MAYRIVYGPEIKAPRRFENRQLRRQILTAAFALLFVLLVRQLWPEGMTVLRELLLPGEPAITEQAFSDMIGNLHDGSPVGEAVTAFCRQIIENGA